MPKVSKKDDGDYESREARFRAAQNDFENAVYETYADAARAHRVSSVTLGNRIQGKHTDARTAQEKYQKLPKPVEEALLDWCIFNGMIGMPWTKETLMSRAQAVAEPSVKITMTWCRRFLQRHRRKLKYKYAYELDPKRASGFNRPTVATYFNMLKKLIEDYSIPIEHIYNMDEKGLQIGGGRSTSRRKHIFGLLQKAQYKLKHDSLELMTIIECICADGSAIKPTFVHQPGDVGFWWENKEIGCCVSTENGWTSNDICEAWFAKVFLRMALDRRVSNAPLVLLLDGHGSHISMQVLDAAYKNGVFIICLPPKTTHKLQPLDVGVFNLVQGAWKRLCEDSAGIGEPITKIAAISRYMEARKAGLHPTAIKDAWRRSVSSVSVHLPGSFPTLAIPPADSERPVPPPSSDPSTGDPPPIAGRDAGDIVAALVTDDATQAQVLDTHAPTDELSHPKRPVRSDYIHDWHGLPLRQQARGYRDDAEGMWGLVTQLWDQLASTSAHAALLQAENGGLRQQIQARTKPRRTQDEALAASQVQKHGFLTNPEHEAAFKARLAELQEKRSADQRKVAEKEARAREVEGRRSLMIADASYAFNGTLLSYKTANLEQLGDLAASLALPTAGLKKAEIFSNITSHLEAHLELKSHPRYANLFCVARLPRRVAPAADHGDVDQVPVPVAEFALPPQP